MSNLTIDKYSHVTRVLHWVSALVISWAAASGFLSAVWAGRELASLLSWINVSVTTLFVPVFVLRVANRLLGNSPRQLNVTRLEQRAADIGHFLLYFLTAVVLASGVLMIERDIAVFDWFALRRPVENTAINRVFADIHRVVSGMLAILMGIHVAAVVRHERRGIRVLRRITWQIPWLRGAATNKIGNDAKHVHQSTSAGGQPIFSNGDSGAMHVLVHQLLDEGREADGHRLLGQWLSDKQSSGSEWVHLQFHMAVFELALGDWDAAYSRFTQHILPAAATGDDALTDAPALLWRLKLTATASVNLPWQPLRRRALQHIERSSDPFVQLHNLLALAGAEDLETIDRWLRTRAPCADSGRECLLQRLAIALHAYATRTYRRAAETIESVLPDLPSLGGSLEQNKLFHEIARSSWRLLGQIG